MPSAPGGTSEAHARERRTPASVRGNAPAIPAMPPFFFNLQLAHGRRQAISGMAGIDCTSDRGRHRVNNQLSQQVLYASRLDHCSTCGVHDLGFSFAITTDGRSDKVDSSKSGVAYSFQ